MRKLRRWIVVWGIMGLLAMTNPGLAMVELQMQYQHHTQEFIQLKNENPDLRVIEGEVVQISPEKVCLKTSDGFVCGQLDAHTLIYCNAMPAAVWKALRPVTDNAFFEARMYVKDGHVLVIDAFYYGEEVAILGWEKQGNTLLLQIFSLTREVSETYPVSKTAQLPDGKEWLEIDRCVFVLYKNGGEIRAVYLY